MSRGAPCLHSHHCTATPAQPPLCGALQEMAPPQHTATASTSTLCKLLTWHQQGTWQAAQAGGQQPGLLHQADWLASLLHGRRDVSDWNNALKLGYDPGLTRYPQWLTDQVRAGQGPRGWAGLHACTAGAVCVQDIQYADICTQRQAAPVAF